MIWLEKLKSLASSGEPAVLITLVGADGSVPRGPGAKMVVTADKSFDTIGGGALEYVAIERARQLLDTRSAVLDRQPLGPALGQCCGGRADLLYEPITTEDRGWIDPLSEGIALSPILREITIEDDHTRKNLVNGHEAVQGRTAVLQQEPNATRITDRCFDERQVLFLFGAGHVGKALVLALSDLPFLVTWVDGRAQEFPAELPANVTRLIADPPHFAVERAPAGSFYLAMTHSHPIDQDICEAVLKRGDQGYLGLIGSKSKKNQFLKRLAAKGLSDETLARMTCPIGLPGIGGKEPSVIAASVAADLLIRLEERV